MVEVVGAEGLGQQLAHREHALRCLDEQVGPAVLPEQAGGNAPHAISGAPSPPTQLSATSRPAPVACRAETMPHSAHRPTP